MKKLLFLYMKKCVLIFILILLSACKTLQVDEGYLPDEEGFYILKHMTDDQLKKLAEDFELSLAELINKKADGYKYKRDQHITSDGDTGNIDMWSVYYEREQIDIICHLKHFEDQPKQIIISPNPTPSSVSVRYFSYFSGQDILNSNFYPPIKVECQLIFNERIIRQWTVDNYRYTIETIPEEYLKESGSYALVCNYLGIRGCTASASASFMVVRK